MSAVPQTQVAQHPASVDAYIRHGWSLVPIPAGTKGPRTPGWNLRTNSLKSQADLPQGFGIGLAHAYSQTCAVDIDDWGTTLGVLALQGIDLQSLYDANDAVIIDSGRAGHGKLLYRLDTPLPSKRIVISGQVVYELRCATTNGSTTQDVLPPSWHPITNQPYQWAGKGHWTRLPQLPDSLLKLWQSLLTEPTLAAPTGASTPDWEEIESAVQSIPADCSRDEWISVGFALHYASTQISNLEQGLYLWDEWSKTAETKYCGEREILTQWHSFKHDKATSVKLGTLFKLAKQYGWVKPPIDAASLFSALGEPVPPEVMIADLRPKPPVIDLSLWPEVLGRRAAELGQTIGCDPIIPLFAGLAAACGVIDSRSRLELLPGFRVPPILWLMTIGAPSDKKTPGSSPMFSLLDIIESEDNQRFAKDLLDWEGHEAAHSSAKKAFLEFRSNLDTSTANTVPPSVPDLPRQPVPLRIMVDDITSQKLVRMCADRPQGLLCYMDEMNDWVSRVTDKTSGENRSCWTKSYESKTYSLDRVGAGSIKAENMAISIYGNIQPRVFHEHIKALSSVGMIQRFIPAVINSDMTRKQIQIPEFLQNTRVWEQTIRVLHALPQMDYTLSSEAFTLYDQFQDWYLAQRRDEILMQSDDNFMSAFGKVEGLVGRLALVFHLIETPFSTQVTADTMSRVCSVVKSYVLPALRYALDSAKMDSFEKWFTEWMIQHCDTPSFTLSTLKQACKTRIGSLTVWNQDQILYNAIYPMERDKWVMRVDDGSQEHRHHAEWVVNPLLKDMFKTYRKDVIAAKQRYRNDMYRLNSSAIKPVYGYTPDMGS